jgi:deoxyribonuclease V
MAVRTKDRTKPVYVSVGHRIALSQAVDLVLTTTRGYRLPEPTRQAHLFANEVRRERNSETRQTTLPLGGR